MTRVLVPLLAVVLLAGCSITGAAKPTPPPKTLSQGRFAYLVHRATRRMVCEDLRRGKATTYRQVRANLKRNISAYERWLFTLRGLAPPAPAAIAFHRMLGQMDRLDMVFHDLADAVDARQLPRIKTLVKRMHRLTARFDARFHVRQSRRHIVCGKN